MSLSLLPGRSAEKIADRSKQNEEFHEFPSFVLRIP
jgi:hypothetical protein